MPYYYDKLLYSPREVIDYFLRDDWFRTKDKYDAAGIGMASMLFRGQSDTIWDLTSTAFRPNKLDSFALQPPSIYEKDEPNRRCLGRQLSAELQAINIFLRNADSLGISTPIDYSSTKHSIDLINAAFKDSSNFNFEEPFPHESLQRATALAQHHGVPTRFLDWTESPLIACYFAAYNASIFSTSPPRDDQEIAIIFITSNHLYNDKSAVELIRAPRHENSQLLQQQGVFTSIKNANKFFIDNKRWPSLDDYSQCQNDENFGEVFPEGSLQLNRVRLPASQANSLLKELFDLNITRHSLMPTLDNAAKAYSYAFQLFKA
jgi:FRG domain